MYFLVPSKVNNLNVLSAVNFGCGLEMFQWMLEISTEIA